MSSATTPAGKPPPTTRHGAEETLLSITISTTVEIDAPKTVGVGRANRLHRLPRVESLREIDGTPQVGTKLTVHMGADGGRGMVFKPAV